MAGLSPFVGLALSLAAFLPFHRLVHRLLQSSLTSLSPSIKIATALYALLLFPGVLLHEASHWLAARLLLVRTRSFSLRPQWGRGGVLRLGSVETSPTDPIRAAVIGAAPLMAGTAALMLIARYGLGWDPVVQAVGEGDGEALWASMSALVLSPDFALWAYLAATVSNTMLPSEADRRAWWSAALILAGLGVLLGLSGMGVQLTRWLTPFLETVMRALTGAFALSAGINLGLIPPLWAAHRVLAWLRRAD